MQPCKPRPSWQAWSSADGLLPRLVPCQSSPVVRACVTWELLAFHKPGVLAVQDKAHFSLEQQLKVIALRHNLLAQMDDILQDRKRMIATLQVCA